MNNIPVSLFLGPLFLIVFFLASLIFVAGTKLIITYFKKAPIKIKPKPKRVTKPVAAEKPVRSIEINPDEVDKIYVKKVS